MRKEKGKAKNIGIGMMVQRPGRNSNKQSGDSKMERYYNNRFTSEEMRLPARRDPSLFTFTLRNIQGETMKWSPTYITV